MPEKLVYVKPAEIKESVMKFGWLQEFGSFNRIPQPFCKMDELSFAEIAKRGTPEFMEYRMLAIVEKETDNYVPAVIYWYKDTGLMVVYDEKNHMEFYQIGCQHDYDEIPVDDGRVDLKCKRCGFTDVIMDMDPKE